MIRAAVIRRAEKITGEDATWMRDISALGLSAFKRLLGFMGFATYRQTAPPQMLALARLGAVVVEDCGPCARIAARAAKAVGVPLQDIEAALVGGSALTGDAALAYRFGRAVAANATDLHDVGDAIEAAHGRATRTELAIGAATIRVYPAIKRGLGYAEACSLTRTGFL